MEVSGEAADLVMKEGVQISEEAIKLLARGAKNLAAPEWSGLLPAG